MDNIKWSSRIFKIAIHMVFILITISCLLPMISVISVSLSNQTDIVNFGYKLIPKSITTVAYKLIMKNPESIVNGYYVSTFITFFGTLCSLAVVGMTAYPISRPDFIHRNKVSFYIMFTMLFNGGLIPWYIVITQFLHLKNTIWVLILPYLANAWYILLLRTFFKSIPFSLIESAKLDGANEYRIFATIIVPLSKTGFATVGLFVSLQYWNDWYLAMLFISNEKLVPLQYMLSRMIMNMEAMIKLKSLPVGIDYSSIPTEATRMAMCIIAAGPMLFVFPFFQKYFVKGLTVGAVKG